MGTYYNRDREKGGVVMEKAFEELQIKDDFMFLYRHRYKCLVLS